MILISPGKLICFSGWAKVQYTITTELSHKLTPGRSPETGQRRRPKSCSLECFSTTLCSKEYDAFVCDDNSVLRTAESKKISDYIPRLIEFCKGNFDFCPSFVNVCFKTKSIPIPDKITLATLWMFNPDGESVWRSVPLHSPEISCDIIDPDKKFPLKILFAKCDLVSESAFKAVSVGNSFGLVGDWLSSKPFQTYGVEIFDTETWIMFEQIASRRPCLERFIHSIIKSVI